jgi:two-component system chemotaxis response regulator CheY
MKTNKTVLIVDDSRLTRTMIAAIIKNHKPDWEIAEACDGEQALKTVETRQFDIMTVDVNMPGIDGISLGIELRKRFPDTHIALVTANIQEAVRERARQAQLLFIPKPITEDRILGFLNTVA